MQYILYKVASRMLLLLLTIIQHSYEKDQKVSDCIASYIYVLYPDADSSLWITYSHLRFAIKHFEHFEPSRLLGLKIFRI